MGNSLACIGESNTTLTSASPSGSARLPAYSTTLPVPYTGSWRTTTLQPYSTTSTTFSQLAPSQPACQKSIITMLQVCKTMDIPVATEKCEGQRPESPSGHRTGLLTAAAQIATRKAAGNFITDQVMARQTQSHQAGAPVSHQKTILSSQGTPIIASSTSPPQ